MRIGKYKKFFEVPLNKLPWRLPLKKDQKKETQSVKSIHQPGSTKFSFPQEKSDIEQRIILEIIRIIQRQKYEQSRQKSVIPILYITSSRAGKAGFFGYTTSYENLDSFYENLAPEVHIKTRLNRTSLSFPVVDYGYENYDPDSHEINRVNFKRMSVDFNSPFKNELKKCINFQVADHHYYINVPCKTGRRSFPDICLLIDTSGSMRDGGYHTGIPWGENSGYHYALLGLYGIIKYLEAEGIASSILWNVINFSDTTRASGWKTYQEIFQLKKHALTPQFGGTEIDVEILRKELSRDPCLVIVLSDGEIYNWEKIKFEMEEIIRPHYVSFIQIGKETKVGRDMQEFGVLVITVKKKEDISQLMVDLTKQVRYSL